MPLMEWDGSLNLGDAMLDRQHKSLLGLINQVHEVSQSPDRDTEIMHSITAMYLYAKEHFFDEEGLMARLGYPERQGHVAMHRVFVAKAHELTDACLDGRMDHDGLLRFLVDWLSRHIAVEDAKIVRFASAVGQERP